jgi:hypothetical protein
MANKVKIINVSDKPYEFTFDSGIYGPINPGEIVEYPAEIAAHAIKRSEMVDPDFGEIIGYRMAYLDSVDPNKVKEIVTYPCPFIASNQCNAKPFKNTEELRLHLDSHWGAKPTVIPTKQGLPMGK